VRFMQDRAEDLLNPHRHLLTFTLLLGGLAKYL
jgi:hypothetical protein